jgi:hypothetical protein
MFYELLPTNGQKSFYGKARVEIDENGNKTLYSYDTKILTITASGEHVKHWNDWSATTGRHIKAFCGLNKKEYSNL